MSSIVFLNFDHNLWLVAISFVVAFVAGATGLSLTKDLSQKSIPQRKIAVALAAIALGGGIWSMHFVGMLGLRLPILFYYDAAITLVSALIAILMVALALLILHFTKRTKPMICAAGATVGAGILAMHYVGMAGMQLCKPIYTPIVVLGSSILAVALCVLAFSIAYGARTHKNIMIGTACFGIAVFTVHFIAMAGTNFVEVPTTKEFGPLINNEVLAIGVILSSFVIFGAFLWVGSTSLISPDAKKAPPPIETMAASHLTSDADTAHHTDPATPTPNLRIPCEREGSKIFIPATEILCVQADGHYTQIYTDTDTLLCPWPIAEATKRLEVAGFLKVHRSYLVNPGKVARFERSKDKGQCKFNGGALSAAPVSRSHLKEAAAAFG